MLTTYTVNKTARKIYQKWMAYFVLLSIQGHNSIVKSIPNRSVCFTHKLNGFFSEVFKGIFHQGGYRFWPVILKYKLLLFLCSPVQGWNTTIWCKGMMKFELPILNLDGLVNIRNASWCFPAFYLNTIAPPPTSLIFCNQLINRKHWKRKI